MRFSRDYKEEPIAIVAVECRLPGGRNVDEFWRAVCAGKVAIDHIPDARFNRELLYDPEVGARNKTYTDLAALVEYPPIDRALTPLPDGAEERYEVAHLAYVETVAAACRRAGYDPRKFPARNTGVFVGHTRPGFVSQEWSYRFTYPETISYLDETSAFQGAVADVPGFYRRLQERATQGFARVPEGFRPLYLSSDLARLVAETFKLDGPGMVFNSACASSLHALSQATLALRRGRIDAAIAGGSTFFHSDTLLLFASSRSMTKNRSCPFDKDADGLVIGEGSVAFILKRLSDALAARDPIMALITGLGIASDGKGKSLWAPRKEGQIEAIRKAYVDGLSASNVDYIEAHATSTALGDATELEALQEALGDALRGRRIPLGSAKGNVGHTLEVAGATGVLKAALALSTGLVPPVGGLRVPNPKIPWSEIPFYAPMQLEKLAPSPNGRARRAACNSFGIGGLNVHIALDEYLPDYWREEAPVRGRTSVAVGASADKDADAIAVVGLGCIFPDAYSVPAFEKLLDSDAKVFRKVPRKVWEHEIFRRDYLGRDFSQAPPFLAGVIDNYHYDWKKNKVPPKQVENASPIQFMMLDATNEALAGLRELSADARRRSGVVVGSGFGGDFSNKMNAVLDLPRFERILATALREQGVEESRISAIVKEYGDVLHKRMPALLDETGSFTPSALSSRITKTLDLGGGAVAVESEHGSFGAAVMCAIDQLLANCNDMMVVIGGQQDLGPGVFDLLYATGAAPSRPELSPFDARANGTAPGEGCGVLLLKRLEDARRDADKIYAVIEKIGAASNRSVYENVTLAAQRANASDARPDVVELPLAGLDSDAEFVDAIADLADERNARATRLGTVTSRIGRFGAGSGAAACVKGALELQRDAAFIERELDAPSPYFARRADRATPIDASNANEPVARVDVVTGENYVYYLRLRRDA